MKTSLSYATIIVLASVPLLVQQWQIQHAREDLANLRADTGRLARSVPASQSGAAGPSEDELARLRRDEAELRQLRDEAQRLQGNFSGPQAQAWAKADAKLRAAEAAKEEAEEETVAIEQRDRAINTLKNIGLAARIHATDNQDKLPRTMDEMKPDLTAGLDLGRYEFYPQPRPISEAEPQLFLFREKEPRRQPGGKWERAYTLADGSVQNATSDTADFSAWEQQARGIASPEAPVAK